MTPEAFLQRCAMKYAQRSSRHADDWRQRLLGALDIDAIKRCDDPAILAQIMPAISRLHLEPIRGHRAGTKWELINMAVRNRLWQIDRAKPLGGFDHNRNPESRPGL